MWHYKDGKKPPKDRVFLADVQGYPWAVMCAWHPVLKCYLFETLQEGMVDGEPDPYFETETAQESEVIAWAELPETPTAKKWGTEKFGRFAK